MNSFLRIAQFSLILISIIVISFFFGVTITLDVAEIQQSKLQDGYQKEIKRIESECEKNKMVRIGNSMVFCAVLQKRPNNTNPQKIDEKKKVDEYLA